jgi:hypothetical protein
MPVVRAFGSWNAAIEAAGLEPREPGDQQHTICRRGLHELAGENLGAGRRCRTCERDRARARKARLRAERREQGVCVVCGEAPAEPRRSSCGSCLADQRAATAGRQQQ